MKVPLFAATIDEKMAKNGDNFTDGGDSVVAQ